MNNNTIGWRKNVGTKICWGFWAGFTLVSIGLMIYALLAGANPFATCGIGMLFVACIVVQIIQLVANKTKSVGNVIFAMSIFKFALIAFLGMVYFFAYGNWVEYMFLVVVAVFQLYEGVIMHFTYKGKSDPAAKPIKKKYLHVSIGLGIAYAGLSCIFILLFSFSQTFTQLFSYVIYALLMLVPMFITAYYVLLTERMSILNGIAAFLLIIAKIIVIYMCIESLTGGTGYFFYIYLVIVGVPLSPLIIHSVVEIVCIIKLMILNINQKKFDCNESGQEQSVGSTDDISSTEEVQSN